jgi:4-amino-4-deoxy-L-arabinose transferase-like glycosyltransferase
MVRRIPPEAVLVGIGLFLLLVAFIAADPAANATRSVSPFTDEGGNVVNARNFVVLGTWSTDEWNRHLVSLPFSLLEAATFQLIGVGIVQARLAMILCVSLTAAALVWLLRGAVGRVCATFAGLAFGFSGLILFYGRLAFQEDVVVLGLTLGTLVLAREGRPNLRSGIVTGFCYAVAVGTKPSALFEVVGILAAMGAVWGWRDAGMRVWIVASSAVIALAGVVWAIVIWLPNQAAVAIDFKIWPAVQWSVTPGQLVHSVTSYVTNDSDHLYGTLLLVLVILGLAGLVAIVVLRERLSEVQARMAVAGFAWAAVGFGVLAVVSYRPNRYVVPLVPSLAILAAIGLRLFLDWMRERLAEPAKDGGAGAASGAATGSARARRLAPHLIAAAAILVAVTPGLVWYGNWARHATYNLPAIQSQLADVVPRGEIVAGTAGGDPPTMMLSSEAKLVVVGLANLGDLYAQGARWYLQPASVATAPVGVPPGVWAARELVKCATWRDMPTCLYHLP